MLVGAAGALAGGGVGLYMDNQEAKLRERLEGSGVSVTRHGDNIILNMPSNITFATDQSDIRPAFYDVLNSVAIVLREFNQTLVDVNGRPMGSDEYNEELSAAANSVPTISFPSSSTASASRSRVWRKPARSLQRQRSARPRTAASKSRLFR